MQQGNTCSKVYIVSLIELLFCSMISKCFSQMPLYIHNLNRMSRIIYLIYKSSFNEIMMEFENIRQISKDNTHRILLVGLIFGIENATMKYWFKSAYCISDRIALLFNDFQVLLSNAFIYSKLLPKYLELYYAIKILSILLKLHISRMN